MRNFYPQSSTVNTVFVGSSSVGVFNKSPLNQRTIGWLVMVLAGALRGYFWPTPNRVHPGGQTVENMDRLKINIFSGISKISMTASSCHTCMEKIKFASNEVEINL